uniref:Uncharacterized protein n=1 Tax=Parastrongyloides trichosuri TaxID=131310 RepID=A0A0N5A3H6_PARTI
MHRNFFTLIVLSICFLSSECLVKRSTAVLIQNAFGDFKDGCFPKASGGCSCSLSINGAETEQVFTDISDCKKPIEVETAENKLNLNKEFKAVAGNMKDNCFPKPSGGCKCTEKNSKGEEEIVAYNDIAQCRDSNERIKRRVQYGKFKPNCVSKLGGGCVCTLKKAGLDTVQTYTKDSDCKEIEEPVDPVVERAKANYGKVVQELKAKFKGLRENCFPRPKGCMCIVGKDSLGHEINEKRWTDAECKCAEGEVSKECPANR